MMAYIQFSNKESADLIKKINFGDIDGLYDPNLEKYFLDEDFWEKIIDSDILYVIGRKGTGKSALYQWIFSNQNRNNVIISNLSFQNFPFEKLLQLNDTDYSRPNQYQSIWRNIILIEICKLIVSDQNNVVNDDYLTIKNYLSFLYGTDLKELHKQATQKVNRTNGGLFYNSIGISIEDEKSAVYDVVTKNITNLNRSLEEIIVRYLKLSPSVKYLIQFDQLDDNFNKYTNNDIYFQCIISLFKVIYNLSLTFRRDNIPVKIIGYLRSDIFYSINQYDSESARWDQYKYNINWAIINRNDWIDARLLKLINRRISASIDIGKENVFPIIFDKKLLGLKENYRMQNLFPYIIHRTFHRPRDLIQFCIKIKQEVETDNYINYRQIENAEKEYSLWLLTEIENEIGTTIKDTTTLYEFLRELGSSDYSISDFKTKYSRFQKILQLDYEELLDILYSIGIIMNVNNYGKEKREIFSVVRNDRSVFNHDLRILTHYGIYKGIYISKFLKK